ncbi:hypothetical protein EIK76_02135 [Rheinheimera mesophila]|uniref:FACT complex subunit SSRP1/POB3 N-terminal PH domain-containing protein n=1 Tax=Rheinheimera mesophila TaxID=1547515 RepID=A0A3P3QNU7_9GAMM|nr:hypothetical protein [Rheinheimera mesophila]KKL02863.1 hypothetical protein SD53_03235 [Rheinheimera mesophila]RRJ22906.1 hypothetical protein EIK76_02135 [Rheinheimera mesophila]
MNTFIADSDALKRRIRYLKTSVYLLLALWLVLIYYKPELINNSNILGLISGLAVFMFFDALLRHYQHALDLHGTEQLTFSQSGFEFIQKSSGYTFVKKNEDIVSVDYRRFLGAPCIRVQFRNNEVYDFKWFLHSELLLKELQKRAVKVVSC